MRLSSFGAFASSLFLLSPLPPCSRPSGFRLSTTFAISAFSARCPPSLPSACGRRWMATPGPAPPTRVSPAPRTAHINLNSPRPASSTPVDISPPSLAAWCKCYHPWCCRSGDRICLWGFGLSRWLSTPVLLVVVAPSGTRSHVVLLEPPPRWQDDLEH